jgi:hypothetical protein
MALEEDGVCFALLQGSKHLQCRDPAAAARCDSGRRIGKTSFTVGPSSSPEGTGGRGEQILGSGRGRPPKRGEAGGGRPPKRGEAGGGRLPEQGQAGEWRVAGGRSLGRRTQRRRFGRARERGISP